MFSFLVTKKSNIINAHIICRNADTDIIQVLKNGQAQDEHKSSRWGWVPHKKISHMKLRFSNWNTNTDFTTSVQNVKI